MNSFSSQQLQSPQDSLDLHHESFTRNRLFSPLQQPKEQDAIKNFYKQELDEILYKKNQMKALEKLRQEQQRNLFNERHKLGQQAERIKELSYKNYYQMISNNQQNLKNKYVNPFQERDEIKNRLIDKGVFENKIKNKIDYERQVKRQESLKKQYQNVLSYQLNSKQQKTKKQHEQKHRNNDLYRSALITPLQIEKLERQRKLNEMNKYKADLDHIQRQKYNMSNSQMDNPQYLQKTIIPQKHDLILNPLPFTIQNPYILKQMQKKNALNSSFRTISDPFNSHKGIF